MRYQRGRTAVTEAEAELSESQQACLRLVAQGMSSKEIAIALNLSPSTVDTYIKHAIARLGAANRRDAARKYLESQPSQNFGSQTAALAGTRFHGSDADRQAHGGSANPARVGQWWRAIIPPPLGGKENRRSTTQRFWDACKVIFWGMMVFLAMVLVLTRTMELLS